MRLLDSVSPSPGLNKPPDVEQQIWKQNLIPAVLLFDNQEIVVEFRNDLLREPNHDPGGGGKQYLLAGEGVGGPNSDGLDRKPMALCKLCA